MQLCWVAIYTIFQIAPRNYPKGLVNKQMRDEDDMENGRCESEGELGLPMPVNHSPIPKFANLHFFFSKLASISGSGSVERRRSVVSKFLEVWRSKVGQDVYPFVRLWFPEEDDFLKQLRRVKDTMLVKLVIEALDLPPKSPDALSLLNIKRGIPGTMRGIDSGIAAKTKLAVQQRFTQNEFSSWTLDQVSDRLVEFSEAAKDRRVEILKSFFESMNPDEAYWLVKIISGNASVNCSIKTFLSILHPDALKVYAVNKNLKMVCQQLWSRDFQVSEVDKNVHLMSHFSPMRAKFIKGATVQLEAIANLVKQSSDAGSSLNSDKLSAEFYMEEKVDGERIQLHWTRKDDAISIFSRNGKDYTAPYQSLFSSGPREKSFEGHQRHNGLNETSPEPRAHIEALQASSDISMLDIVADTVDSCILDGEIVAWDPDTNEVCGQSKIRELVTHQRAGRYRHMFLVFDILLVNDDTLTDIPLKQRKAELERLIPLPKRRAARGRIQILPYKIGHDATDISIEFDRIVNHMSEGLVVKDPKSRYEIDGRTNSWVKVKPEYVDGYQGENLDLIVVGCYYGSGKNRDTFASYLCALRDETHSKRYVSLSRVGSGICYAMHEYIRETLEAHMFASKKPPPWLTTGAEKHPDFYVDPDKSLVFEVKYSSISTGSAKTGGSPTVYGSGFSLRFPRYVRVREDKDFRSALTIGEFMETYQSTPSIDPRLSVKKPGSSSGSTSKRLKLRDAETPKPNLRTSGILEGLSFYVCGDTCEPEYIEKADLESRIVENGGLVRAAPHTQTMNIADRNVPNAAKLIAQNEQIFRPQYIFDCLMNGRVIDLEPGHYFSGQPTEISYSMLDSYGFSLYRKQSRQDIFGILNSMNCVQLDRDTPELKRRILQELCQMAGPSKPRAFLFAGYRVYEKSLTAATSLVLGMLRYGSAEIVGTVEEATHYLFSSSDIPKSSEKEPGLLLPITSEWVHRCWQENTLCE